MTVSKLIPIPNYTDPAGFVSVLYYSVDLSAYIFNEIKYNKWWKTSSAGKLGVPIKSTGGTLGTRLFYPTRQASGRGATAVYSDGTYRLWNDGTNWIISAAFGGPTREWWVFTDSDHQTSSDPGAWDGDTFYSCSALTGAFDPRGEKRGTSLTGYSTPSTLEYATEAEMVAAGLLKSDTFAGTGFTGFFIGWKRFSMANGLTFAEERKQTIPGGATTLSAQKTANGAAPWQFQYLYWAVEYNPFTGEQDAGRWYISNTLGMTDKLETLDTAVPVQPTPPVAVIAVGPTGDSPEGSYKAKPMDLRYVLEDWSNTAVVVGTVVDTQSLTAIAFDNDIDGSPGTLGAEQLYMTAQIQQWL